MKKLIILAIGAVMLGACSTNKTEVAEGESVRTDSVLIKRLQKLQADGKFAFGHHDDLAYGFRWAYAPDSSDVKNVTGEYPAIVNWDLGLIEWGCDKELDGVPFTFIHDEAIKHHNRGGINTISWHLRNPVTKGDSWDTSCKNVVEQVLAPGALNDTVRAWVGLAADFIGNLRDADGNRIPVVFRPWHEHTGEWFWWGEPYCTAEQFKALWKLTREVFDQKGIDNVVWAYSPDKSNGQTYEQYMNKYPGDEYVDIVGADVYHFDGEQGVPVFTEWMKNTLGAAAQAAKEHGKVLALTETGSEALPLDDWYMRVLMPAIQDYPIAYITVWRNAMPEMKKDHFYTPYKGHRAEKDFIDFYKSPKTVFINDLPK